MLAEGRRFQAHTSGCTNDIKKISALLHPILHFYESPILKVADSQSHRVLGLPGCATTAPEAGGQMFSIKPVDMAVSLDPSPRREELTTYSGALIAKLSTKSKWQGDGRMKTS